MADEQETPEVASIISRIESWLDTRKNKIELDLTKDSLEFNCHNDTLSIGDGSQVKISLAFKDEGLTKNSSLDQIRSNFNYIVIDRLPLPGLDGIPSQWQIYPQTPMSSFSEGVTFEQYDPKTQILQLLVQTQFFAIYGNLPQLHRMACGPSPKGTYLQVRRDIQGVIKLRAKVIFSS